MSILETVQEDVKEALRSGDAFRRDTLRTLSSALKNSVIEKRGSGSEFSDQDAFSVIRQKMKRREESALQYRAGNRPELAEKEDREKDLLAAYLPAAPSNDVLIVAVRQAIAELHASGPKDLGKVIGAALKALPNAPGNEVRRIASDILSGK